MKPNNFNSQTQQDFIVLSTCNCGIAGSSVHSRLLPLKKFAKTLKVTCFLIIPLSTALPYNSLTFLISVRVTSKDYN